MTGRRSRTQSGRSPTTRPLREAIRRTGRGGRHLVLLGDAAAAARTRRDGMYAVYAFCREVDDIADDDAAAPSRKRPALDRLARRDRGALRRPAARHLSPARCASRSQRYRPAPRGFPRRDRRHGDGRRRGHPRPGPGDARPVLRAASPARSGICRCMCSAIRAPARTRSPIRSAARLQLTNILRDLDEDAQRGRLYLPREILERHGIRSDRSARRCCAIRRCRRPAAISPAIARGAFRRGRAAMARCSRRAMRPAAVMGAFYRAMLDALLALGVARPERPRSACRSRGSCGWCCATGWYDGAARWPVHVVGAGLAGLAAAVALAGEGRRVVLYEAAQHAGGRCRSFFDAELGCRIDNGNHLLLSGNRAALAYLDADRRARHVRAAGRGGDSRSVDLATGERWAVRPNARRRAVVDAAAPPRRVPGTRARDYLGALRLRARRPRTTPSPTCSAPTRVLYPPPVAAARGRGAEHRGGGGLGAAVLARSSPRRSAAAPPPAGRCCRARACPKAWSIRRSRCSRGRGGEIRFGARLRAHRRSAAAASPAVVRRRRVPLGAARRRRPRGAGAGRRAAACPGSSCRTITRRSSTRISAARRRPAPPPFVGLVGGTAEWVFRKPEVVSVTVSAADRLVDRPAERAARAAVARCRAAPDLPARRCRRRASSRSGGRPSAPPRRSCARRPRRATRWHNLHLAGDYVDTGLPATIEGAIRSGLAAAAVVRVVAPRRRQVPIPQRSASDVPDQHGSPARVVMTSGIATAKAPALVQRPSCMGSTPRSRAAPRRCSLQRDDGHWVFELEADATIPAEYILLQHYSATRSTRRSEQRIARYLRGTPGRSTAAGRCSTAASSTSAPRSRPISR